MYGFSYENNRFYVSLGEGIQKNHRNDIKDVSMERKKYGFTHENNRFHVFLGAGNLVKSQK